MPIVPESPIAHSDPSPAKEADELPAEVSGAVADPSGDESLGLDLFSGRYFVEYNLEGITHGTPGEWILLARHDTLAESIRACSDFLEMVKDSLGVARLDSRRDHEFEPWIRVMDMWSEEVVLWVEDRRLHVQKEVRKVSGSLRHALGLTSGD